MEPYQSGELPPPRSEAADLGYETESAALATADKPVVPPVETKLPTFFTPAEVSTPPVINVEPETAVAIKVAPDAVVGEALDEQQLADQIETISLGDLENDLYRS